MQFNEDLAQELNLILKFPDKSLMQGIKIHNDADSAIIAAAKRLHEKGITTQSDGGYLTDLGHDLAGHAQIIYSALTHC